MGRNGWLRRRPETSRARWELVLATVTAWISVSAPSFGDVVVLAGDRAGRTVNAPDPAVINEPFAVAFDAAGRAYGVEYTRGNRLFRVGQAGVEFVAGGFSAGPGKPAADPPAAEPRFHGLHDVAIGPDGIVYVADTFSHRIQSFDPRTGATRVVAGTGRPGFSGDGGPAGEAEFDQPYCCSLAPDGSALLVADIKNSRLRRIDLGTGRVTTVAGNGTSARPVDGVGPLETPLAGPRAACLAPDGTIYLALREGNALVAITPAAVRVVVNGSGKPGFGGDGGPGREALLAGPKYVSLDRQGRVLIADTENHCIRRWDPPSGTIVTVAGTPPRKGARIGADFVTTELARPHGCLLDPEGRLVVADSDNDRILVGPLLP